MEEVLPDLDYVAALPGRKILLRGNHDFFWSVRKTSSLNEKYDGKIFFLQNNFEIYEDIALVGSKGYQNEDGKDPLEQSEKLLENELKRLRISLEAAKEAGYQDYMMFLHYPPAEKDAKNSPFIELAKEYSVTKIIYSHLHGEEKHSLGLRGVVDGIEYFLVSADYLNFKPQIIA